MKIYQIVLILLFGSVTIHCQEEMWLLELNNGSIIEAEIAKKDFYSISPTITYINKSSGKKETVSSSDLSLITNIIEDERLVYEKIKLSFRVGKKPKFYNELCWSRKIYGTDKIEAYIYIANSFNNSGVQGATYNYKALAFKLSSEDYIIGYGPYSKNAKSSSKFNSKFMNRLLKAHFKDSCPEFSNNLHKLSYMMHEFKKIAEDFTNTCK